MNILGNSGYNIEEVCKFIINKDKRKTKKHE